MANLSMHYYPASVGATEVKPGMVWWNEQAKGWSFSVNVDGVFVRSLRIYLREEQARDALKTEVAGINKMLREKTKAAVIPDASLSEASDAQ